MKITLESTTKVVDLQVPRDDSRPDEDYSIVPARIWKGVTSTGIKCHAYITRLAVDKDDDASEFERELVEHRTPSAAVMSIPLRLII